METKKLLLLLSLVYFIHNTNTAYHNLNETFLEKIFNKLEKNEISLDLINNNFYYRDINIFCLESNFLTDNCKFKFYDYLIHNIVFYLKTNNILELDNCIKIIRKKKEIFDSDLFLNKFLTIIPQINDVSKNFKNNKKTWNIFSNIKNILEYKKNSIFDKNYEIIENFYFNFYIWPDNALESYIYFKQSLDFFKNLKEDNLNKIYIDNSVLYLYKIMFNNPTIYLDKIVLEKIFYNFFYKFFLNDINFVNFYTKSLGKFNEKKFLNTEHNLEINKHKINFFFYDDIKINISKIENKIINNFLITFNTINSNYNFYIYKNFDEYKINTENSISESYISKKNNTIDIYLYQDNFSDITYFPVLVKKLFIYNYLDFNLTNIDSWFIESFSKTLADEVNFCDNIYDNIYDNKYFLFNYITYDNYLLNMDFVDQKIYSINKYDMSILFTYLKNHKIDYSFLNNYSIKNMIEICNNNFIQNIFLSNVKNTTIKESFFIEYNNFYFNFTGDNIIVLYKNNNLKTYSTKFYIKTFKTSINNYLNNYTDVFLKKNNLTIPLRFYDNNFNLINYYDKKIYLVLFNYMLENDYSFYSSIFNQIKLNNNPEENFLMNLKIAKQNSNNCKIKSTIINPNINSELYNASYSIILPEQYLKNNYFIFPQTLLNNTINNLNYTFKDLIINFNFKYINESTLQNSEKNYYFTCLNNNNQIISNTYNASLFENIELNNIINDMLDDMESSKSVKFIKDKKKFNKIIKSIEINNKLLNETKFNNFTDLHNILENFKNLFNDLKNNTHENITNIIKTDFINLNKNISETLFNIYKNLTFIKNNSFENITNLINNKTNYDVDNIIKLTNKNIQELNNNIIKIIKTQFNETNNNILNSIIQTDIKLLKSINDMNINNKFNNISSKIEKTLNITLKKLDLNTNITLNKFILENENIFKKISNLNNSFKELSENNIKIDYNFSKILNNILNLNKSINNYIENNFLKINKNVNEYIKNNILIFNDSISYIINENFSFIKNNISNILSYNKIIFDDLLNVTNNINRVGKENSFHFDDLNKDIHKTIIKTSLNFELKLNKTINDSNLNFDKLNKNINETINNSNLNFDKLNKNINETIINKLIQEKKLINNTDIKFKNLLKTIVNINETLHTVILDKEKVINYNFSNILFSIQKIFENYNNQQNNNNFEKKININYVNKQIKNILYGINENIEISNKNNFYDNLFLILVNFFLILIIIIILYLFFNYI